MTVQTRTTLKGYFETGDTPTQAQFIDLIDTIVIDTDIDTFAELDAIVADQTLVYAGGALGTPSSGALGSCTAYEGTAVASTGEAGGTKYLREDGDGTCSWQTVAGGDVTKVGTPLDSQLGVWTGDGTIEGDADLTFDTSTNTMALAPAAGTSILSVGGVNILVDSPRGTLTLSNVDALDATTETTIEAAIDTLANLTSAAALATVGTIGTGTWQGTAVGDTYIASATTWNAKQDALTFGIADGNAVDIDVGASILSNDYCKFSATGLIGQTYAEVKTDLSLSNVENTALSTWAGTANITTLGTITTGTWNGTAIEGSALASTGEAGGTKFLREDGDGTCSWQTPAGSGNVSNTGTPLNNQLAVWTDATTVEGDADVTFDTSTNTLALAGAAGTSILAVGGANILVDSPRGTMTLSNVDAIDATTETTLEAAIDSLTNLVTVGTIGTGVWQGTAVADGYIASAATWNGKIANVVEDTTPQLGGALDGQGYDLNNMGVLFLTEQAAAEVDVAGKGQFWVQTATPNIAMFTDDAGTDFELIALTGGLGTDVGTFLAGPTVTSLAAIIDTDGTGDFVRTTSPTLATPSMTGDLVMTERADHASTPGAGFGYLWTKNTAPSTLFFTDDAGTDTDLTASASGDALVANPLSQFAATTSLQLKGVISDETGSGLLVFATDPVLTTPNIGTPSAGTLTNCTGLPQAGTVGLTTADSPQFTGIELGHATDTTLTRVSAGVIAVEGTNVLLSGGALGTPASGNLSNCTAYVGDSSLITVGTIGTGTWQGTAVASAYMAQATDSAKGALEIATAAEVDTGTDNTRALTPDNFQASKRNLKWFAFNLVEAATDCATATNIAGDFVSPIAGVIQQSDTTPFYLYATNSTAGTTGTMVVDIHLNGTTIMTTNKLDFDTTEKTTTTAATPPDLTTTALAVGDIITIDIDSIHTTAAKGLTVYMAVLES